MTVENIPKPLEDDTERRPLYPERPSFSAERLLYEIEQLQSGDKPKEMKRSSKKLKSLKLLLWRNWLN